MAEMTDEERQALYEDLDDVERVAAQALGAAAALANFLNALIPVLRIPPERRRDIESILDHQIEQSAKDAATGDSSSFIVAKTTEGRILTILKGTL